MYDERAARHRAIALHLTDGQHEAPSAVAYASLLENAAPVAKFCPRCDNSFF
ncbi:MAG TPA: hypothetical protein VKU02_17325 [Gemmataceae bacterium]|nr:hypothetical protein [Gemmataceae bacterium]